MNKAVRQRLMSIAEAEKKIYDQWVEESTMWPVNLYMRLGSVEKVFEYLLEITKQGWIRKNP